MRTSGKLGIAFAAIGGIAGLWFVMNRGNRELESDARVDLVIPLDPAHETTQFYIDWSKWPRRKGGAQLMLANRGKLADLSDPAALEREREASDALLHDASFRNKESRRRLEAVSPELLIRMRVRDVDPLDRTVSRNRYVEADSDGWVASSLPGWPIQTQWGLGLLDPNDGGLTDVEFEWIQGPEPPAGTKPSIVVHGQHDSELLEGALVGFAIVNGGFVLTLLVALAAVLTIWAHRRRAAAVSETATGLDVTQRVEPPAMRKS